MRSKSEILPKLRGLLSQRDELIQTRAELQSEGVTLALPKFDYVRQWFDAQISILEWVLADERSLTD